MNLYLFESLWIGVLHHIVVIFCLFVTNIKSIEEKSLPELFIIKLLFSHQKSSGIIDSFPLSYKFNILDFLYRSVQLWESWGPCGSVGSFWLRIESSWVQLSAHPREVIFRNKLGQGQVENRVLRYAPCDHKYGSIKPSSSRGRLISTSFCSSTAGGKSRVCEYRGRA